MKKYFEKLGNIPTILVLGLISVCSMAFFDIVQGIDGYYDYLAGDICLIVLFTTMVIFACVKNKVATLGIFTLTLGAYFLRSFNTIFYDFELADALFTSEQGGLGFTYVMYALENAFLFIAIVAFIIAKFFMKRNKTVVIDIILISFVLTFVAGLAGLIGSIASNLNNFGDLSSISYVVFNIGEFTGPILFIACGVLTESVSK